MPGAVLAQSSARCFPETVFCIDGRIREFWEQNGGLEVYGFPLAPQGEENPEGIQLQAQWFERERFELHPENQPPYDVLLGRLGDEALRLQGRDWRSFPAGTSRPGCLFFEQTSHSLCGSFLTYWRRYGIEFDGIPGISYAESLALFGMPLSEPQPEKVEENTYTVQWFERARFELHPENQPPYDVLFGLLGRDVFNMQHPPLPKITLSAEDLAGLEKPLSLFGLKPSDVNAAKTVTYALPRIALQQDDEDGVVLMSAPMFRVPRDLQGVIGVFKTTRPLQVSGRDIQPGLYVVALQQGVVQFIDSKGERQAESQADQRQMQQRFVNPPEATITNKDICYSWERTQICTEPAVEESLTDKERNAIGDVMPKAVQALADKGLLDQADINTSGTVPEIPDEGAVKRRQATLLVAPTADFPPVDDQGVSPDNTLIGTFLVLEPIQTPTQKVIPSGAYAARFFRVGEEYVSRLFGDNGMTFDVPIVITEVRAQPEEPLVILIDMSILGNCIPWWENCPPRI
jgi:hypothetical protein